MLIVIALFIVFVSLPISANAEWYIAGDLLQARYQGPQVDGTWQQQQLVSQRGIPAVRMTKESMAWDVGLGYRFADGEDWYAKKWSIEGGYRHFGSGVSAGGLIVPESVYERVRSGELDPRCIKTHEYEATDHLEGGYLRATKGFDLAYGFEAYVSAGAFVAYHDLNFWIDKRRRQGHGPVSGGFTGIAAGPTVGGGLKWEVWQGVKARFGAESHWALTESGHPISSQWVLVGGGIEVPLAIFGGSTRDYFWQRL